MVQKVQAQDQRREPLRRKSVTYVPGIIRYRCGQNKPRGVGIPLELYPYELQILSARAALCLPAILPIKPTTLAASSCCSPLVETVFLDCQSVVR